MTKRTKRTKRTRSTTPESTLAGSAPTGGPIPDASDIEALWMDQSLGDGIVHVTYHDVPVGKPRDFFRTVPDPAYRRRAEIYTHKPEGAIDEVHYIIAPTMHGQIPEARPVTLVTVVNRDGSPRLLADQISQRRRTRQRSLGHFARGSQGRHGQVGKTRVGQAFLSNARRLAGVRARS
jgi:hypothetical protein